MIFSSKQTHTVHINTSYLGHCYTGNCQLLCVQFSVFLRKLASQAKYNQIKQKSLKLWTQINRKWLFWSQQFLHVVQIYFWGKLKCKYVGKISKTDCITAETAATQICGENCKNGSNLKLFHLEVIWKTMDQRAYKHENLQEISTIMSFNN